MLELGLGFCVGVAAVWLYYNGKRKNVIMHFTPGGRYYTVSGSEVIITQNTPQGARGYIIGIGFRANPRTPCQWNNEGRGSLGNDSNLIIK